MIFTGSTNRVLIGSGLGAAVGRSSWLEVIHGEHVTRRTRLVEDRTSQFGIPAGAWTTESLQPPRRRGTSTPFVAPLADPLEHPGHCRRGCLPAVRSDAHPTRGHARAGPADDGGRGREALEREGISQ